MQKKLILNADDFGLSLAHNYAVLYGYKTGMLTSASLCANGIAFENAVFEILPNCPDLGLSVHLNIMEGKSLTNCPLLTDKNGNFNKSFLYPVLNLHNKKMLQQIENEFEAQIKKVISFVPVERLDSHVHTHAIPKIFKITCKLAKKYDIKSVRTQFEKPYIVPDIKKHMNLKYPINLIKIGLLGHFTNLNKKTAKFYGLKTNDNLIGIGYTGLMDKNTVKYGLKAIKKGTVEVLIHPCKYDTEINNSHTTEFNILKDLELKNEIQNMGFDFVNYKSDRKSPDLKQNSKNAQFTSP